jgi:hypothetical protein
VRRRIRKRVVAKQSEHLRLAFKQTDGGIEEG